MENVFYLKVGLIILELHLTHMVFILILISYFLFSYLIFFLTFSNRIINFKVVMVLNGGSEIIPFQISFICQVSEIKMSLTCLQKNWLLWDYLCLLFFSKLGRFFFFIYLFIVFQKINPKKKKLESRWIPWTNCCLFPIIWLTIKIF